MEYAYYGCLVLVAILQGETLSVPTGKDNIKEVTLGNVPNALKRQTNSQNHNYDQQQISQEYFDIIQQTDATGNLLSRPPPFRKQNAQDIFSSDVFPPTTTTTLSPFATQQVQLQEDYARRTLVEQQTALIRSRQRPFAQLLPPETFQVQSLSVPQEQSQLQPQQPQTLRFVDRDGHVRQQNLVPQQRDFVPQQPNFVSQQQDFVQPLQQQSVAPTQAEESFSYAQIQFGPATAAGRSKGQRSVSRSKINQVVVEPVVQQTVDYPSAAIRPEQFSVRLLQNVVYVQPNGQMYKPIEDTESVVHIPRKNHNIQQPQQWPITSNGLTTDIPSTSTTTSTSPLDVEPAVFIPRPKKPNQQRTRHESRKLGNTHEVSRTERLQQPQYHRLESEQQRQEQSSEVEPDNFLTSLLTRLQVQQQQPETTVATVPKVRGGQRSKGGNRPDSSKYLPDRSQLQLLQFPHELKSLSTAELKALEEASVQITDVNDKSVVVRQKQLLRNKPVPTTTTIATADEYDAVVSTAIPTPAEVEELYESLRHNNANSRPVPTPVQLNEQQRQFLASQGIRHLYRVDYDQSGNVLPLTYVLALDNRSKRIEQPEQ